jgi:hypothetical protein
MAQGNRPNGCGWFVIIVFVIGAPFWLFNTLTGHPTSSAAETSPPATRSVTEAPPAPDVTLPPEFLLAGTIEFGGSYNESTLEIVRPAAHFKTTSHAIAYVIHLSEAAGTTKLTFSLTRRASGGAETTILSMPLDVANPDFDTFGNSLDLGLLVDRKAGTYVMRIIREGNVLAEGTFTLVK